MFKGRMFLSNFVFLKVMINIIKLVMISEAIKVVNLLRKISHEILYNII